MKTLEQRNFDRLVALLQEAYSIYDNAGLGDSDRQAMGRALDASFDVIEPILVGSTDVA